MKKASSNNIAIAILIGSFVIAVAILISAAGNQLNSGKKASNDPQKIYENIQYIKIDNSPYLGDPNAPVTIVEFIDFECPVCKNVYDELLPKIKKEYIEKGEVKFVYKSLPLDSIHFTARIKAKAAFCAYKMGGDSVFFKYHDELFNQYSNGFNIYSSEKLSEIAAQLNFDVAQFNNCLESEDAKSALEKDFTDAVAINADGTPTWLIGKTNGDRLIETVKVNGLHPYFVYETIIDELLKK